MRREGLGVTPSLSLYIQPELNPESKTGDTRMIEIGKTFNQVDPENPQDIRKTDSRLNIWFIFHRPGQWHIVVIDRKMEQILIIIRIVITAQPAV